VTAPRFLVDENLSPKLVEPARLREPRTMRTKGRQLGPDRAMDDFQEIGRQARVGLEAEEHVTHSRIVP
jgi:hypothetical protein